MTPEEIQAKIDQEVAKAVEGLKSNNSDLKNEKTQLKEQFEQLKKQLDSIGGVEGITKLSQIQNALSNSEEAKLLKEGQYDKWLEMKTEGIRSEYEGKIEALTQSNEEYKGKYESTISDFRGKTLESKIREACTKAGVIGSAVDDVILRAKNSFSFDDDGNMVIKGKDGNIEYLEDGKTPKGASEWVSGMKETARHWFGESQGSGAGGSGRPGEKADLSNMSMDEYMKHRKSEMAGNE